jgi:hypothetical protein
MAVEAPLSKFKKTNFKIYIAFCIGVAIYCAYDGYFSEKFREKHTGPDGKADITLLANRFAPPVFGAGAVILGAYLFAIRSKKLIADEKQLIISDKESIAYDSIQKIDKTHFKAKGFFIITYKNNDGREVNRKLSDRAYDNLAAVLDQLVAKIT